MIEPFPEVAPRLNAMLAESGLPALSPSMSAQFEAYFSVLQRWNARINLTAIRSQDEILRRHFVESIAAAHALPAGIASLLDFGSGAGFPGLPIAICRPQIGVVVAESQIKKAAFLHEAVRTLAIPVEIFTGRAETTIRTFDCVILRAVDQMRAAVGAAALLVSPGGWLALLTTQPTMESLKIAARQDFAWRDPVPLPSADDRVLLLGTRA